MATRTQDIRRTQWTRSAGALALAQAVSRPKATARRLGRSRDTVDRYLAGHESSPVYRHDMLMHAVDNPWPLVTHARVTAMRASGLGKESTTALVRRWWERTLAEHTAEAAMKRAVMLASMDELATVDEAEATVQVERAAVTRELAERGVDPRAPEWVSVRDAVSEGRQR